MPKFEVTVEISFSGEIVVEAENKEAASLEVQQAHIMLDTMPYLATSSLFSDITIDGVSLVEEDAAETSESGYGG